jgi:hypothetical protein
MDLAPSPHEGIDLKVGEGRESKIGGTVIASTNAFLLNSWLTNTVDHASCAYMADIRSFIKKTEDTRIPCASRQHPANLATVR